MKTTSTYKHSKTAKRIGATIVSKELRDHFKNMMKDASANPTTGPSKEKK